VCCVVLGVLDLFGHGEEDPGAEGGVGWGGEQG
jgi:hypothetical protein